MNRFLRLSVFVIMGLLIGLSLSQAQSSNSKIKNNYLRNEVPSYSNSDLTQRNNSPNNQPSEYGLPFVRINENLIEQGGFIIQNSSGNENELIETDSICSLESFAKHGQTAPNTGGGTLNPVAFVNPTTLNNLQTIAFFSLVNGSARNQGIFTADSNTIYAIAIGSGSGGGSGDTSAHSGDPSPIGGTFSGFFGGTAFAPDINNLGDVLFLCDVNGGSSYRGLFLYKAATQSIIKIAVVGDPSPIGGTFGAVGPGSINNNEKVVFLASPVGTTNSNIFMWDNGTVTKVAAIGDPAPGGGTFSLLGTESYGFPDGTNIPAGPVPDINDNGQISFRAIVNGGITERGIIVRTGGTDDWYIKSGDSTPAGGTYFDMQAASINNAGQIAFFADYRPTPTSTNSGWFAGSPGNWRKVIAFFDSIDGGQCLGLAFSRNPMQTVDSLGNVVFWTDLNSNGGIDRLAIGLADGSILIAARRGQASPIGGTIGSMDAWPSLNSFYGTLNAATPGASGGALSAHMVFGICVSEVPVELTSFSAALNGNCVELSWSTATETNNRGFEIQKSYDGRKFITIGFVDGKGTTSQPETYSFADKMVSAGSYTYRLKQVDFDGTYKYSNTVEVKVNVPLTFSLSQNYPNPFNPTTTISWQSPVGGWQTLKVYDVLGREVATLIDEYKPAGKYDVEFDGSNYSSGVYFYKLRDVNYTQIKKMILLK